LRRKTPQTGLYAPIPQPGANRFNAGLAGFPLLSLAQNGVSHLFCHKFGAWYSFQDKAVIRKTTLYENIPAQGIGAAGCARILRQGRNCVFCDVCL
jgi:hypothetical protein